MRKRKKVADFVGIRSLYTEYRHGCRREVGLPGTGQPKRLLRGQRREQMVRDAVRILEGWSSSPFEYEGAVRAGLRSGLCLAGHGWVMADFEAEQILAEAFRLSGSVRPSYEEGQREYADRLDFCAWCGGEMPEGLVSGGRLHRFCSSECANSARSARDGATLKLQGAARFAALRLVWRENKATKSCAECGKPFVAKNPGRQEEAKYCGRSCSAKSKLKYDSRACLACGEEFRPKNELQKFCCIDCRKSYGVTSSFDLVCHVCGEDFSSPLPYAMYCGKWRKVFASNIGRRMPKRFTAKLFDYLFTAPVAMARATRPAPMFLTAGLFDNLFREAA